VKILAVDTALGACSVALAENGAVIAEDWREMQRGHAEALAPMVDSLMRKAGVPLAGVDRLAVTTGPGTFTGQRVGLAFMRAMALALKKPVIGITTMDAMAEAALRAHADAVWAIAVADAKRGEVYLGARSRAQTVLEPMLVALEDAPARLAPLPIEFGDRVAVAGTATGLLLPLIPGKVRDSGVRQPHARDVARLGATAPLSAVPKPLYLRAPDAKLPGSV
jgi:tRNA threonylcarbamoyladenosine biosynthesis protein TsaB